MNVLYTYKDGANSQKAIIAAKYSNTPLHITDSTEFQMGVTNRSEEYLKKFPLGKVPALETADGVYFTESVAIAYFLSNQEMKGTTPVDAAHVYQWSLMAENELVPHLMTWILPCMGILPFNKKETERAKEELQRLLGVLDAHLSTRTYFVGEALTLADTNMMCNLLTPFKMVFDQEYRSPFINLNRWFDTMINQPNVKAVIGDIVLCEKMALFDAKKYAEMHPKEKKIKEPKKQENVVKEEEPKEEDPLKNTPRGDKFNLEAFKKEYAGVIDKMKSADEKLSAVVSYLEKNFDEELYSIYECTYNFPDDLPSGDYMVRNLVNTGFKSATESLCKYYFGVMQVYFSTTGSEIHGFFFFLGQDVVFSLYPDFSDFATELYSWKKHSVSSVGEIFPKYLNRVASDNIPFNTEFHFV